jgi:hypothetical protein
MTIKTTDAFRAAKKSDEAWNEELHFLNISRYSPISNGALGSTLRALYDAKVAADRVLSDAFERDRMADRDTV